MNLNEFVMAYELPIRLGFFFGVFGVMAVWELLRPRRRLQSSKAVRWANNLGLVFFNSVVVRLAFPTAAVGMAVLAGEQGWGVFNYVTAPFWMAVRVFAEQSPRSFWPWKLRRAFWMLGTFSWMSRKSSPSSPGMA